MTYRIALLHNQTVLTRVNPQPATPEGLQTLPDYAASGDVTAQSFPFTLWSYTVMTPEQYNDFRTLVALSDTVFSNPVTARTRRNDQLFQRFNGVIVHIPGQMGKFQGGLWRDVSFLLKTLKAYNA